MDPAVAAAAAGVGAVAAAAPAAVDRRLNPATPATAVARTAEHTGPAGAFTLLGRGPLGAAIGGDRRAATIADAGRVDLAVGLHVDRAVGAEYQQPALRAIPGPRHQRPAVADGHVREVRHSHDLRGAR